jgi:hypothetical protein
MINDGKKKNNYEFFTLDRKNVDAVLNKINEYYRKNGRTIVGE